jgi:hypothetical protein
VRLDHLLSKEHHEKGEASGLARAVRSRAPVVGAGLVHNNESPLLSGHFCVLKTWAAESLNTLLGPETTPGVVLIPGEGLGRCCCSILVVGCGVCLLDSGCEHLSKIC